MIGNTENVVLIEKENTSKNIEFKEKINIKNISYICIKRIFDIIGALLGFIILIPVTAGIYLARKILKEDEGPIFYEQLRYGKNGKQFRLFKFRSMCINADEKLKEYLKNNPEAKKEYEENQKLQDDPRITKVGKILRKTSLDELPQVINILLSQMSIIGCRPIVSGEIERYGIYKNKFLSVKPGLTGYWQVNGRSNTTYEDRIKMELYYADNKSLWLDTKIFLKTIICVLKKEGAI